MLEGRYKIVFNYVRKQINKENYHYTTGVVIGGITLGRVVISPLNTFLEPNWFIERKRGNGFFNLTKNLPREKLFYLRRLLEKELNNEQI